MQLIGERDSVHPIYLLIVERRLLFCKHAFCNQPTGSDVAKIRRRDFLAVTAAYAVAGSSRRESAAGDIPRDIRITRVVGFDLVSRRPKLVGKNSRLDVHGDQATDRMVRLYTNAGLEGVGNCRGEKAELSSLIGKRLVELYEPGSRSMKALGAGTMPLWDLVGKALGEPAYELLGGKGPERVPVYDGSIYFADLLPEKASRPLDRFKEEIDMGRRLGHRAFKIKIGRGAKWMEAQAGYERDKAVLRTIRSHAGPDAVLGVDANNGYDLASTKRLLSEMPDFEFAFVEEMFPEKVDDCLALKAFIREQGWQTLVADGETQSELAVFKPFIERRAIDVLQGDMNHFGLEGILTEAEMAKPAGIQIAPHNWGSLMGFYMQLHVGRAITNLYMAENDPLTNDVIVGEGFEIKDGACSVPALPGFGLKIDEEKFRSQAKVRFDLRA
jgi:L-alanine-DL-glutamate epimerase-like enolase superfamily enzyme